MGVLFGEKEWRWSDRP